MNVGVDVRYLVPVLPLVDLTDGLPLATAPLHGSPLFVHAVRALVEAGGDGVVVSAPPAGAAAVRELLEADRVAGRHRGGPAGVEVVEGGETLGQALLQVLERCTARNDRPQLLVVHDPRCPLVPQSFLRDAVTQAADRLDAVLAATRPMTDTVKTVVDGVVLTTVDRDLLVVLTSPVVLPVAVLRELAGRPELAGCADVDDVVNLARVAGVPVQWMPAPGLAWRVDDVSSISVLESVTDGGRRPR